MSTRKLTAKQARFCAKQARFCEEYLSDCNGTQAAIRAELEHLLGAPPEVK